LGIRGKEEVDFQNLDELLPLLPEYSLNGGVIYGSPGILVLIERKLGIRVVYLKFERFGFGWGSLMCLPETQMP
jgi:hypothetical protein